MIKTCGLLFFFQLNIAVTTIASGVVLALVRRHSKSFISILAFCLVPCPFIIWFFKCLQHCNSANQVVPVCVFIYHTGLNYNGKN